MCLSESIADTTTEPSASWLVGWGLTALSHQYGNIAP